MVRTRSRFHNSKGEPTLTFAQKKLLSDARNRLQVSASRARILRKSGIKVLTIARARKIISKLG